MLYIRPQLGGKVRIAPQLAKHMNERAACLARAQRTEERREAHEIVAWRALVNDEIADRLEDGRKSMFVS